MNKISMNEKIKQILVHSKIGEKEVDETLAIFQKIRDNIKKSKVDKIVEVAAGHGALGFVIATLLPNIKTIEQIDLIIPKSYYILKENFEKEFPWIQNKVIRKQKDFRLYEVKKGNIMYIGIHPCMQLCDDIIDRALYESRNFIVVPCCLNPNLRYNQFAQLNNWGYNNTQIQDLVRVFKILNHPNFTLKLKQINSNITPKNHIIIGKSIK